MPPFNCWLNGEKMTASWAKVKTVPVPSSPLEQWNLVTLSGGTNVKHWAFRIVVPSTVPPSYNTLGYWGLWQTLTDQFCIGPTQPIPLVGRGAAQALTIISEDDYTIVAPGLVAAGIAFSVHKWLDPSDFELWAYSYP